MRTVGKGYDGIQVLRAIAANLVVLNHIMKSEARFEAGHFFEGWASAGISGVDLFFVISGFIMMTIANKYDAGAFIFNRATRIYPPYWVYTTVVLFIWLIAPWLVDGTGPTPSLWRSYLLVPDVTAPLHGVGWTLIHEMYFYLAFTAIIALRLPKAPAVIAWASLATLCGIWLTGPDTHHSRPVLALITHPLTLEFMFGVIVAKLYQRWGGTFGSVVLYVGLVIFLAGWLSFDPHVPLFPTHPRWDRVILFGIPSAFVVYGCAAWRRDIPRLLVLLGDASYSIYLSHVLVVVAIAECMPWLMPRGVGRDLVFAVLAFVATNAFGVLSYRRLELPLLEAARHVTRLRRPRTAIP